MDISLTKLINTVKHVLIFVQPVMVKGITSVSAVQLDQYYLTVVAYCRVQEEPLNQMTNAYHVQLVVLNVLMPMYVHSVKMIKY